MHRFFFRLPRFLVRTKRPTQEVGETVGQFGERLAANYLKSRGYRIVAQNELNPSGELDLIAVQFQRKRRTVVFVEVKTWARFREGSGPSDAVDDRKQKQITNAALYYLRKHRLLNESVRFDVISIVLQDSDRSPTIRHFENAFEAVGTFQLFN